MHTELQRVHASLKLLSIDNKLSNVCHISLSGNILHCNSLHFGQVD